MLNLALIRPRVIRSELVVVDSRLDHLRTLADATVLRSAKVVVLPSAQSASREDHS
jgi:hypothetical protein